DAGAVVDGAARTGPAVDGLAAAMALRLSSENNTEFSLRWPVNDETRDDSSRAALGEAATGCEGAAPKPSPPPPNDPLLPAANASSEPELANGSSALAA